MDVDTHPPSRLLWRAVGTLALAIAVGGCASRGGAMPPADAGAPGAMNQTAPNAGPVTRLMQAVGLVKAGPSVPKEHHVALRIFTAQNLNAGPTNKALAAVVNVYHLRSVDRFRQMPFNDFLDRKTAAAELGNDLVDSREMLLLPAQRYTSTERLPPDARYIGIVTLFRGPATRRWRFAYDTTQSEATGITLGVHACAMTSTAGVLVTVLPDDPGSLASVHCPKPGS